MVLIAYLMKRSCNIWVGITIGGWLVMLIGCDDGRLIAMERNALVIA